MLATVHNAFNKALNKKRSLAAEPTKIAPFREATMHPHKIKITPAAHAVFLFARTAVLTIKSLFSFRT
jgi:hypothetical protein